MFEPRKPKKNQYYCITKGNQVVYVSTSEKACYKVFCDLEGDFNVTKIDTLGVLQNL